MTDGLVLFVVASLALIAIPGPSVIYIVTRSVTQDRRAGLVSMLGVETGALVHVAAAALGLSALLASSAEAFMVVKYAGAAYLVYLGVRRWRERSSPAGPRMGARRGWSQLYWEGVLVNVLNPKVALFFLAFLPQFVDPAAGSAALQVALLGAVFVALAVLSDGAYALAAGTLGTRLRGSATAREWLDRASAGVYVALGATTALSGDPEPRSGSRR